MTEQQLYPITLCPVLFAGPNGKGYVKNYTLYKTRGSENIKYYIIVGKAILQVVPNHRHRCWILFQYKNSKFGSGKRKLVPHEMKPCSCDVCRGLLQTTKEE